ncbi:MAG TPA: hypothetical protein PLH87_03060 [Bacillota bacterium]|nr:hypothetical protein [Bacillota bacterium]
MNQLLKISCLIIINIILVGLAAVRVDADWLKITGEKGFSFSYDYNETTDSDWLEHGYSFSQSLLLDVEGEFGDGYSLEGHLIDQQNSPVQLFLKITGRNSGLSFGNGNLNLFSTPLSSWSGDYNGLDLYYKKDRHDFKLTYANPTGVAVRENAVVNTGNNYCYLTYLPIKEGSLKVYSNGRLLNEGVDYQYNYFTGKLELTFFPEQDLQLELEYHYLVSEVLGNRFLGISEQYSWNNQWIGVEHFSALSRKKKDPILIGEEKQPGSYDLSGIYYGFSTPKWRWDLEYWNSREKNDYLWDYLDDMEGVEVETEAFSRSTMAQSWYANAYGSAAVDLDEVSAIKDGYHTREGKPSLVIDYRLQRTGDSIVLLHDLNSYRDFNLLSKLSFWFFLNNQDLQLRFELLTSENNYYYYTFTNLSNNYGWHKFDLLIDPVLLAKIGAPDLKRIRYVRVVLSSPVGASYEGKLYLAPVVATTRNLAEQRWSTIKTAPGSTISVTTVKETVIGEAPDNQVLEVDYNLAGDGWGSITYQPSVVMDISKYQDLKLFINHSRLASDTAPLRMTVIAGRGREEYQIGTVIVSPNNGWREYSLSLKSVPRRILERVEQVSIRIDGSGSGALKLDALKFTGYTPIEASALKVQGRYQDGAWSNFFELQQLETGFRDLYPGVGIERYNVRNITEYLQDKWRLKTDLATYSQADAQSGLPVSGNKNLIEVSRGPALISLLQTTEEVTDNDEQISGERQEVTWRYNYQWRLFNFDYRRSNFESTILERRFDTSDSLMVKYQRENLWLGTQLWQADQEIDSLNTRKHGRNYEVGLSYLNLTKLQLNGGITVAETATGESHSNFWNSDFAFFINDWINLEGVARAVNTPEDREGLMEENQYNLRLVLTPKPQFKIVLDQNVRSWETVESGDSKQVLTGLNSSYYWGNQEKLIGYYTVEDLSDNSGIKEGSRFGLNGDLVLFDPWLTQFAIEYNIIDNYNSLFNNERATYKYNIKNSLKKETQTYYWGGWVEGIDYNDPWKREMLQLGWEKSGIWSYGNKLDFGVESDDNTEFEWGLSNFLKYTAQQHLLEVNLNYQTYAEYLWKFSINYRFVQSELLTFNLSGDFLQDRSRGRDLRVRADCLFYLR